MQKGNARGERAWLTSLLIAMFVIGPTVALAGLALPHSPDANDLGIIVVASAAYAIVAVLTLFRRRLPTWGLEASVALATGLISASIYFTGATITAGAFYYLWVVLGAAYFFDRRQLAIQLAIVAIGYGAALALKPYEPGIVQTWMVAVVTLAVTGTVLAITRERVASLIARLAEVADTDPLTELLNRRGFSRQLDLELERARRFDTEVSLISGDLDHFKQVNDRFGHQAGDQVLSEIGRLLRRHARRIDSTARVGGEEFALLAPGAGPHGAYAIAERLRARVSEAFAERHPGLTISFGVASYPSHGDSVEGLLHRVDQALYAAKALGRDRTVVYSAEVVAEAPDIRDGGRPDWAFDLTMLLTLARSLDMRASGCSPHSDAVGSYAEAIARSLGLPAERVERIGLAGMLHDIGKIGVPESVLNTPGPLTEAEWRRVRAHPEIGANLLTAAAFTDLRAWVLAHHERVDGTGYPFGLRGDAIPLEARILGVADAFEAMQADRPYRQGRSQQEAIAELRRCSGTQFDPLVVEALVGGLVQASAATLAQAS